MTHSICFSVFVTCRKNYAQLEKDGLSIVFEVKKFWHYLLVRHFTMLLTTVAPIWKVKSYSTYGFYQNSMLGSHTFCIHYDINYKSCKTIVNGNTLYRLPLPDHLWEVSVPKEIVLLLKGLQTFPLNADQIKAFTIMILSFHGWRHQLYKAGFTPKTQISSHINM